MLSRRGKISESLPKGFKNAGLQHNCPFHPLDNLTGTDTDMELSDTDDDGCYDGDEIDICGTDPIDGDMDGDGWSDVIEARCGGDAGDGGVWQSTTRINFQPSWAPWPWRYCVGGEEEYGLHGYGWN